MQQTIEQARCVYCGKFVKIPKEAHQKIGVQLFYHNRCARKFTKQILREVKN